MWFSCVIYDTDVAIGYTLFADIIAIVYPLIILFQKYNIFISKDSLLFWNRSLAPFVIYKFMLIYLLCWALFGLQQLFLFVIFSMAKAPDCFFDNLFCEGHRFDQFCCFLFFVYVCRVCVCVTSWILLKQGKMDKAWS